MIIVDKNEGTKIAYVADGTRVAFADDLTINLAAREQDWPVHIDICFDADKNLVIGAAAGRSYVAQLDIPKRQYKEIPGDSESPGPEGKSTTKQEPIPLDMNTVKLSLWAIE